MCLRENDYTKIVDSIFPSTESGEIIQEPGFFFFFLLQYVDFNMLWFTVGIE